MRNNVPIKTVAQKAGVTYDQFRYYLKVGYIPAPTEWFGKRRRYLPDVADNVVRAIKTGDMGAAK